MVLAAVVVSAMARVIAVARSLSRVIVGTPASVEGVACITVVAEMLMYQDRGTLPTALWLLVDQCVPVGAHEERALASVELVSS